MDQFQLASRPANLHQIGARQNQHSVSACQRKLVLPSAQTRPFHAQACQSVLPRPETMVRDLFPPFVSLYRPAHLRETDRQTRLPPFLQPPPSHTRSSLALRTVRLNKAREAGSTKEEGPLLQPAAPPDFAVLRASRPGQLLD